MSLDSIEKNAMRASAACLRTNRTIHAFGRPNAEPVQAPMPWWSTSGHGCWLRDVSGNEYLDYLMGSGPLSCSGMPIPAVVEAVSQRLSRGSSYLMVNESASRTRRARSWPRPSPAPRRSAFNNSGSESTFFALRMARAFTGREKTLKFEGRFSRHARLRPDEQSMDARPPARATGSGSQLRGHCLRRSEKTSSWLPGTTSKPPSNSCGEHGADDLAAVILEPLQRTLPACPGLPWSGSGTVTRKNSGSSSSSMKWSPATDWRWAARKSITACSPTWPLSAKA